MSNKADRGLYRRRGSPYWWVRYADRNGRLIRESTGTTEKKLARDILAKKKVLVAENRHLDVRKIPKTMFFELCDQYWDKRGKHLRMKGLGSMIKIWKQQLGNRLVASLRQTDIENLMAEHFEGLKKSSRNRHITQLKAMFNWAIEEGLITHNPAAKLKKVREVGRTRYLTTEEIQRLLAACGERLRLIVLFALHTGMRKGEIFDLKWFDVNMGQRMVWVHTSHKGAPKHIPLDETVMGVLERLPRKNQYVFPSTWKGCTKTSDVKKGFKAALERAKIEDFTFHDLRHTFASHLVMSGVRIEVVAELLGHSTTRMTQRYAHLAPDFKARSIGVLDEVFAQKPRLRSVK